MNLSLIPPPDANTPSSKGLQSRAFTADCLCENVNSGVSELKGSQSMTFPA